MKPEDIDAFNALMEEAEANRPIHRYAEVPLELMRRIAEAIAGLRWSPVGEQLPRAAQCVMVPNPMSGKVPFKEQPRYVERYYNRNLGIWLDLDGRTVDPPTHWMPLPAPPETA